MRHLLFLAAGLSISTLGFTAQVESGVDTRTHLGVSIYKNFAVIDERRRVTMPRGSVGLEVTGIASTIVPRSVSIDSDSSSGFVPFQQNYRYDLLNRQSLLERFVGRKIKYSRTILEEDSFESFLREGILLSVNPEIVQFGDVIEVEPLGTISLPYIPDDLKTEPTLVFGGENGRTKTQTLAVRYQAADVGWEADYSLVLGGQSSLGGWITVNNHAGMDLEIDTLRFIAGEVNQAGDGPPTAMRESFAMAMDDAQPNRGPVGDYHAYEFSGSVLLPRNQVTQLRLLTAEDVTVSKSYRMVNSIARYQMQAAQTVSPSIVITLDNDRRIDQPLPAGLLRVYEDTGGREVFLGESRIPHSPRGKPVEVEIGRTFDIQGERIQTGYRKMGERSAEISYRIILTNTSDNDVTVQVDEKLNGDWQIGEASLRGEKIDAMTYRTHVRVPAGEESGFEYTLDHSW